MEEKYKGPLAYLLGWLGGVIVLFAFKDNTKLTKFHACQAITLDIIGLAVGIIVGIISAFISFFGFVASIISILLVVCKVFGIAKSYKEEECELPVISDLTRNIFKKKLAEGDDVIINNDNNDNNNDNQ